MLTVHLSGGLGNQLFQLAAGETIAKQTNHQFYLKPVISENPHSKQNYLDSIFKKWLALRRQVREHLIIYEGTSPYRDWSLPLSKNVIVQGQFQDVRYIPPSFVEQLVLPSDPFDMQGVFLHIRGGDYVGHPLHDVQLEKTYYPWAISQFPENTHFYIFTNDIPYAKSMFFLHNIRHSFVDVDEVQSLNYMRQCSGGICANSTFSWWGAFLNPTRKLILPSKWFNDERMYTNGYFFSGSTIGPV